MRTLAVAAVLIGTGWFAQSGMPYQTGHTWFEFCSEAAREYRARGSGLDQMDKLNLCSRAADDGFARAGFVFSRVPEPASYSLEKPFATVVRSCPSAFNDLSMMGDVAGFVLLWMTAEGGTSGVDRFIPASWTIQSVFERRWPGCKQARVAAGMPRMVRTATGVWDFEAPWAQVDQASNLQNPQN
jgi:hypothetical protein